MRDRRRMAEALRRIAYSGKDSRRRLPQADRRHSCHPGGAAEAAQRLIELTDIAAERWRAR